MVMEKMEHPASLLLIFETHCQAAVAVSVRQLPEVISALGPEVAAVLLRTHCQAAPAAVQKIWTVTAIAASH